MRGRKRRRIGLESRRESKPARPSDYIKHLEDLVQRGRVPGAVLYARVSGRTQDHGGNLKDQLRWLRQRMQHYGVPVVDEFKETGSGWEIDRDRLIAAARCAQKAGAVLVAESTDRFIRSIFYDSKRNPSAQPTAAEFEALRQATRRALLATIHHPDAPWKEIRSHQIKRGQDAKGHKGGRPREKSSGYKKRRRLEELSRVLRLRQEGLSYREISRRTGVATMVVWEWVNKYE